MSNNQELIKVLSIDGGGVRGIIPSMVLAEIENKTGKRIAEMFDLMAGTSAGGIITLGLNVKGQNGKPKFSAKEISKFFTDDCPEVFKKSPWKKFTSGFGLLDEKYDHGPLVTVLKKYMEETNLKSCKTKTLISTYDILNRHPQFFKSWSPSYENHKMREIARATSAAPTYFEPMELKVKNNDAVLVDGGVFINNPAVSAYSEAIKLIQDGQ
ncbi:MAG: patatin-like phospholipase family protein, partial [Candidatus Dadabacteria bacterium]|nr:patatin-like phospholipase family protein [Candidatus Dadabacteria bacterium]